MLKPKEMLLIKKEKPVKEQAGKSTKTHI